MLIERTAGVLRSFAGRVMREKPEGAVEAIARRILAMGVDVLAVQEVEDRETLERFNRDRLGGRYRFVTLVEGNDPRLIDVGVLSKLPLGGVTSWRHTTHPSGALVFSRDFLEVEVLSPSGKERLFTLFNTHLKSPFVLRGWRRKRARAVNDARRALQASVAAGIVEARMRPGARFAVLGDMNDSPRSAALRGLVGHRGLGLVNALARARERVLEEVGWHARVRERCWTYRYKPRGKRAQYLLFDQIWLSGSLAGRQGAAWIERRRLVTGDGSDHDPAWVELDL